MLDTKQSRCKSIRISAYDSANFATDIKRCSNRRHGVCRVECRESRRKLKKQRIEYTNRE